MGAYRSRPLFNIRARGSDPSYMLCRSVERDDRRATGRKETVYTLYAGLAEGIVPNESLHLFKVAPFLGEENSRAPFGTMLAADVSTTLTVLKPHPGRTERIKIPSMFYAKRTTWYNAPASIYCQDGEFIQSLSVVTRRNVIVQGGVVRASDLVDDPVKASLILTVESDNVCMDRNDPILREHLPQRFPHSIGRMEITKIQRIISAWRHFDYHLNRGRGGADVFPLIRLELHWLEPTNGNWEDTGAEYRPVGANLLPDGVLVHQIVISDEQTERPLGFTLYNDGNSDVYPHLFYFDPVQLTISESASYYKNPN